MAGKGEGSIVFYELSNEDQKQRYARPIGSYRSPIPQKGGGWVPKRVLETTKREITRFLKLTKDSVVPISFIVCVC